MTEKIKKKCWLSTFSWFSMSFCALTVGNNLGKLYIAKKYTERAPYSTRRFCKILQYKEMTSQTKWRKYAYFFTKLAIVWVWMIQFQKTIPFFATSERAKFDEIANFKIWQHQKIKFIRDMTSLWRHHIPEKRACQIIWFCSKSNPRTLSMTLKKVSDMSIFLNLKSHSDTGWSNVKRFLILCTKAMR